MLMTTSRPKVLSGAALGLAYEVLEQAARWTTAPPNDLEPVVEVGRLAQQALAIATEHQLRKAPLVGTPDELNAPRRAFAGKLFAAMRRAERELGPWWATYPDTLWMARVDREIARFVSRTGKVSYDSIERRVPSPRYWDDEVPGLAMLWPVPCLGRDPKPPHHAPAWNKELKAVSVKQWQAWSAGKAPWPAEMQKPVVGTTQATETLKAAPEAA
jgi:hypothetical protein